MNLLLLIATGQLSLLAMAGLRKLTPYAKWLAAVWVWLTALCLGFLFLPSASVYLLLLYPFLLRALLLTFFEKTLPRAYYLQLLPAVVLAPVVYWLPAVSQYAVPLYLVVEVFSLLRLLHALLKARGIGLLSNASKKVSWLRFFVLTSIFCGVLLLLKLYAAIPAAGYLLPPLVLLLSALSGWYFAKDDHWEPLKKDSKYHNSTLDQVEKYRILTLLDQQLTEKKFALDSAASLAGLARKVQATPHQLSQVINETKGMSFFELLAWHRVQEAKKMLKNPLYQHLKIEEIGEQVGYLSKSSFNTVFKKQAGKTPSEYRDGEVRKHDIERSNDEKIPAGRLAQGTFGSVQNTSIMFSNFLKVYLRNLSRNKAFTLINITGLVVGLGSALLIWLYIQNELSYDTFHHRAEDIHRIAFMSDNPQTRTPHPMALAMVREFPEVEAAVSLTPLYGPGLSKQSMYIRNPEKDVMFREPDGYAADSTFFQVFGFELLVGNEQEALKEVGGLIISESLAKKYFGDENPLGKLLEIDTEGHPAVVTGIMKNPPANSHFHPNFIVSYVTLKYMDPTDSWFQWGDYGHFNYVKLAPGADAPALEAKMPDWLHRLGHLTDQWYAGFESGKLRYALQPITDIHLKSHIRWELEANGNIVYVYILIASIVFILVIASINFINLSTARAFERAKEVGVRRTLGAGKWDITFQFLAESIFTCLFSLVLAYGLVFGLFGAFQDLAGKVFTYSDLLLPETLVPALGACVLIGTAAAVFPALAIARIKAGEILKGKFVTGKKSEWARKALVVVQFGVSAILIFGSIILISQVKYMEGVPLGYSDEQVLVVDLKSEKVVRSLPALTAEIAKLPGVSELGAVSNLPGTQFDQQNISLADAPDRFTDVSQLYINHTGQQPLGLQLAAGRWFDPSNAMDSLGKSYILNETAVRELGLTDAVGSKIVLHEDDGPLEGYVVGVVKDFHFQSLHVPIQPLIVQVGRRSLNFLLVKVSGGNVPQLMSEIETIYTSFDDKFGFEAFFLDQKNQQLYEAEKQALTIFNTFAAIALFLAALGLLGLAYLIIIQRTKEIGIRKILGATIWNILWKENKAFLKLITIALVLGLPLAYLIMNEWLAGFAYRVAVGPLPYLATFGILVLIATACVSIAILRTVLVNPGQALRYE